jgi:hypothetical protein
MVYIYNEVLFSHKEEQNYVICRKMDRTEDHNANKISQTQKNKWLMLLSYAESRLKTKKGCESRRGAIWEKEANQWEEKRKTREGNGR